MATGIVITLASACSSPDRRAVPTATVPESPEPASPTSADPFAVPPVIDAAYVNRVLAALENVVGDAARVVLNARALTEDAVDRLRAVYFEPEFSEQLALLRDAVGRGLTGLRQDPGNRIATVSRIISASPSCIFIAADIDDSPLSARPVSKRSEYYVLKQRDPARDPRRYNQTPWAIPYEGFNPDGSEPVNPC